MQNSILKLTALAGVVGIGFLGVLQAQRGLTNALPNPLHADAEAHAADHQHEATGPEAHLGDPQAAEGMFSDNPAGPPMADAGSGSPHFTSPAAERRPSSPRVNRAQDPFGAAAQPFESADAGFPPQQSEPSPASEPANPFVDFSAQVDAVRSTAMADGGAGQAGSAHAMNDGSPRMQGREFAVPADRPQSAGHDEVGNPFADASPEGTAITTAVPESPDTENDPWLAADEPATASDEETPERVQLVGGTSTPERVENADLFDAAPGRFAGETAKPLESTAPDQGTADSNAAEDTAEVTTASGPQFPGMNGRNTQTSALVPADEVADKDDSYYFEQDSSTPVSEPPLFEADAAAETDAFMAEQPADVPTVDAPAQNEGTGVLFTSEDPAGDDDAPSSGGSPTPAPVEDAFQLQSEPGETDSGDLFGGADSFADDRAASESSPFATDATRRDESEADDTFTTSSASSFGAATEKTEPVPTLPEESTRPRPVDLPPSVRPDVADENDAFTLESGAATSGDDDDADRTPFGNSSIEPGQSSAPRLAPAVEPRRVPANTGDGPDGRREPLAAPGRLEPPQDAVRMLNGTEQALQGTGTVTSEAAAGQQSPELTIEKIAPPAATLGAPMVYSILIRNIGNSEARQVVVEDEIPKGTKLTGTIPRAKLVDKTLVWQLGTLAPGAQKKISVRVVPFEEGQIGSVARVNFVAAVAAKTTITKPLLELDVNAPSEARVGEQIVFQFKLANRGNADALNVFLRDIIPDGLKHPGGNDLEYEVGTLAAGQSRDIQLTVTAAETGELVNHAVVTADGGAATEIKAAVNVIGNKFRISRSGPKARYVGRQAVYENTIQNESRHALESITVIETVPEGMQFVQASGGGQYNAAKREIAWRVDTLEPLGAQTFEVTLVPTNSGMQHSNVRAYDSYGTHAEVSSQTKVVGFANLTVDIPEFSGAVPRGEQSRIRISVRNRGANRAQGVSLTLQLPPEVQFVSAEGPAGHRVEGNQVVFGPIDSLDGRGEAAFDVSLTAVQAGDVRLHVQVDAEGMSRPVTRDEALIIFDEQR